MRISRMSTALFAFASYNAGPFNIAKMRAEAAASGLDPAHPQNRHQSTWPLSWFDA